MEVLKTDKIWDIVYAKWTHKNRLPKYILGTDRNWNLKWLDYNLFITRPL
jgi:hypothetical protein